MWNALMALWTHLWVKPEPCSASCRKLLSRPDGLMFYGELGEGLSSSCEIDYPNMEIRQRRIRTKPSFHRLALT